LIIPTRQTIKRSIIKNRGTEDTYMMFFQILQDDDDQTYFFNLIGLYPEEIKSLKPIKHITNRRMRQFFQSNYDINDMGKYREEREIINCYFPATLYEDPDKVKYFVFSFCQNYLENKGLLKKLPEIKVVLDNKQNSTTKK